MKKLLRGIVEFQKNVRPGYRETFARLALGQKPDTLFISCSDSRVDPSLFASTDPGDLFAVRNVGNIIAPAGRGGRSVGDLSEASAIEYATLVLGVQNIIVCGHSSCGAMKAILEGRRFLPDEAPNLHDWLHYGEDALRWLKEGFHKNTTIPAYDQLSQLNVLMQLRHLETYPTVDERLRSGKLTLHGWWFDIGTANVQAYEEQEGHFVTIDEVEAARIYRRLG